MNSPTGNNHPTNEQVYQDNFIFDALNTSNWDDANVFSSLAEGQVTAINATIVIWENYQQTIREIEKWKHRFEAQSTTLASALTIEDIKNAKETQKTGVILGWQNATPIENDLNNLSVFYDLGVRIIQLTYNERNLLGNGCYERKDEGLSHFGVDAVKEMNELGILIDLSHCGDQTCYDAIELSEKPVAITHSNSRNFFVHPRNKPEPMIKLLVEKGGVIGANAFPPFLPRGFESTLNDYVDAIEDLVYIAGVDHVGIGTDFTQGQSNQWMDRLFYQQGTKPKQRPKPYPNPVHHPNGLENPSKLSSVATELVKRGYAADDVGKILGGNWMRLLESVWKR
ncbi:membrane dipeptidase [SAR202 cluster bacterium AD-804-J14_MRT_500m]|nr:membrane dipeptidase [SAR202 cluster bacterium AD-804-J14_MRT_500m]